MAVPDTGADYVYLLGPITLEIWKISSNARTRYGFRFYDAGWTAAPVFEADNFKMPSWATLDETALDILSYLLVQEGEEDDFFFREYTPEQIRWRDARAAVLRPALEAETREVAASRPKARHQVGRRKSR